MTAINLPGQLEVPLVVDHKKQKYWLCCGSTDPMHSDKRGNSCYEAKAGHPDRCRFGTVEDHGKWGRDEEVSSLEVQIAKLLTLYEERPTSET